MRAKVLSIVYARSIFKQSLGQVAKKEYEQALGDYDQAIRLAPRKARAYYHRGLARGEFKRFAQPLADYDQAIRLDPRFNEAYLSRAWLLASRPNIKLRAPRRRWNPRPGSAS